MSNKSNFFNYFSYQVYADIPGFTKSNPDPKGYFLSSYKITAEEWYKTFVERVTSAIGNEYLPIYRMADGEAQFLVGWQTPHPDGFSFKNFALWAKRKIMGDQLHTCWGEEYTALEKNKLLEHYIHCLKKVSEKGILAVNFVGENEKVPGGEYYHPLYSWFINNNIVLGPQNYFPFYFIYALLSGPDRGKILKNKNILVVTSTTPQKRKAIEQSLHAENANSVQFIEISPNKALLDKIDVSTIDTPVDVILVGGGIGSVNILSQLESFSTLCIDSGLMIECLVNPSLRGSRPFTLSDESLY